MSNSSCSFFIKINLFSFLPICRQVLGSTTIFFFSQIAELFLIQLQYFKNAKLPLPTTSCVFKNRTLHSPLSNIQIHIPILTEPDTTILLSKKKKGTRYHNQAPSQSSLPLLSKFSYILFFFFGNKQEIFEDQEEQK